MLLRLNASQKLNPWAVASVCAVPITGIVIGLASSTVPTVAVFTFLSMVGWSVAFVSRKLYGDYWSPAGIFGAIWFGTLGLYSLRIVHYPDLRLETWFILVTSAVLFICAAFGVGGGIKIAYRPSSSWTEEVDQSKLRHAILMLFIGGTLGTIIQIVILTHKHGFSVFLVDPVKAKEEFNLPLIGYLHLLNMMAFVAACVYVCHFREQRLLIGIVGFFALVSMVFDVQKTNMLKAVVWAFFSTNYSRRRKIGITGVLLLALCGLVLFIGFTMITSPYYQGDYRAYVQQGLVHLPRALAPLSLPYIYLTAGYPCFQMFVDDIDHYTYGAYTFKPVLQVIAKFFPQIAVPGTHGPVYWIPVKFNTYTFLRHAYLDFGVIGVIVYPFVLGCLSGYLYRKMIRGAWHLVFVNGLVAWMVFISFFSNHWSYSYHWYLLAVGLWVGRRAKRGDTE